MSTYDIVVVVKDESGMPEERYIFEKQSSKTVTKIMKAMDKDRVFTINDAEYRLMFFRPNEVSKLQFNLRESWGRA